MSSKQAVIGPCEAKVIPLRERTMRACGKPGHAKVGGRVLCDKHATIARRKERAAAEKEGAAP